MTSITVRDARKTDLSAFKNIISQLGLFPSELLDDMTASYFTGNPGGEIWKVAETTEVMGFAYCAPERMTQGTENLLLLAVAPEYQRHGIGTLLSAQIEHAVTVRGSHLFLVETSATDAFDGPRRLYASLGFKEIARIDDYYQMGEGKVIFGKKLK